MPNIRAHSKRAQHRDCPEHESAPRRDSDGQTEHWRAWRRKLQIRGERHFPDGVPRLDPAALSQQRLLRVHSDRQGHLSARERGRADMEMGCFCNNHPSQVQFRVIVLSPRLKPSVTGSIGITMSDGAGNLIRDWDRVFTTKVSSSALVRFPNPLAGTLSNQPPLLRANATSLPGRVGGIPRNLASARSWKLEYQRRREWTDFHKGVPSGRVHPSQIPGASDDQFLNSWCLLNLSDHSESLT